MSLNKYYLPENLNTTFQSDYKLLEYILKKYDIACGSVLQFAGNHFYELSDPRPVLTWKRKNKVPPRLWNLLHKELILLRVTGKIKETEVITLSELQNEFDSIDPQVDDVKISIKIQRHKEPAKKRTCMTPDEYKEHNRESLRKYYQKNKDTLKEYLQKYRRKEYLKKWRQKNKAIIKEYQKKYQEYQKKYQREYRQKNKITFKNKHSTDNFKDNTFDKEAA